MQKIEHSARLRRGFDYSWNAALSGVMRFLGLALAGNSVKFVQTKADEIGLNISHFKGRGWSTGMTNMPSPPQLIPLEKILVEESRYAS